MTRFSKNLTPLQRSPRNSQKNQLSSKLFSKYEIPFYQFIELMEIDQKSIVVVSSIILFYSILVFYAKEKKREKNDNHDSFPGMPERQG